MAPWISCTWRACSEDLKRVNTALVPVVNQVASLRHVHSMFSSVGYLTGTKVWTDGAFHWKNGIWSKNRSPLVVTERDLGQRARSTV